MIKIEQYCRTEMITSCYRHLQCNFIWRSRGIAEGDVLENDSSLQLLRTQVSFCFTLGLPVKIAQNFGNDSDGGHRLSIGIQNLLKGKLILGQHQAFNDVIVMTVIFAVVISIVSFMPLSIQSFLFWVSLQYNYYHYFIIIFIGIIIIIDVYVMCA